MEEEDLVGAEKEPPTRPPVIAANDGNGLNENNSASINDTDAIIVDAL